MIIQNVNDNNDNNTYIYTYIYIPTYLHTYIYIYMNNKHGDAARVLLSPPSPSPERGIQKGGLCQEGHMTFSKMLV